MQFLFSLENFCSIFRPKTPFAPSTNICVIEFSIELKALIYEGYGNLRIVFRIFRILRKLIRRDQRFGMSVVNVPKSLGLFWPNTSGTYKQLSKIAIEDSGNVIQSLIQISGLKRQVITNLEIPTNNLCQVRKLQELFNKYGSDKARGHDYHLIYGQLLERDLVKKVLEIGIGSTNSNIPSNMGKLGRPGASLRAFKEFFPNAVIFGLDFDSQVLFQDERIKCFQVDQRNPQNMSNLESEVGGDFDLMIDDGLHSIVSSINSLSTFLKLIRVGGYAVVEDIPERAIGVYELISKVIFPEFTCNLFLCRGGYLFIARKMG